MTYIISINFGDKVCWRVVYENLEFLQAHDIEKHCYFVSFRLYLKYSTISPLLAFQRMLTDNSNRITLTGLGKALGKQLQL